MTIERLGNSQVGARRANGVSPKEGIEAGGGRGGDPPRPERHDRVEISREGRALSGAEGLEEPRLAEIRLRLESGAYHSPEVASRVAERLLPELL
ncbi:MAG: flagellar biosynthesis anti-sigma factor FlgM [Gemmatimonadota bacterium]|nr:flagellar biosynthesis anti-sigma factor FlgM [Gemmatimonadota bacterium]